MAMWKLNQSVQISPFKNTKIHMATVNYICRRHNIFSSMLDPEYGVGKICLTAKRKALRHYIFETFNLI